MVMGIQDLYKVLDEQCKGVFAVDISIFLNKYVKSSGPDGWLASFIFLLCTLKKHGIKMCCVFDGPNPPLEKRQEQERRRSESAKKQERINYGKKLVQKLEKEYLPNRKVPNENMISEIKTIVGFRRGKGPDITNYNDITNIISGMKNSLDRQTKQNSPILPIYSKQAKEIIEIVGFPHFQAEGEAEALCASMCCSGLVDGVISEDTDVLAYGTPYLLSRIDLSTEKITVASHEDILTTLNFTTEEFRDLCILLGCDYNDRVKGFPPDGKNRKKPVGLGMKGAFAMIDKYRSLEAAEKYMTDADPLNYRRCRELFTPLTELPEMEIPYNRAIDKDRLIKFLKANSVKMNINYILDTWKPVEMHFHDEGDDDIMSDNNLEIVDW
jgi:flap endonuclease-1